MNNATLAASWFLLGCVLTGCEPAPDVETGYDILITNGSVYDGSLRAARNTNIGVVGGRIESMQADAESPADVVIDASGLTVLPGFIDPHTHALEDLTGDDHNANLNYLMQGVATVIIGNDGDGFPDRPQATVRMQERGIGTNVAFFAGHGVVREAVLGLEDRAPTATELERMREAVAREMRAGALGLSTGLFYAPGSFATTEEVIELAKVAARFGGVYDSHLRDEASYSIGLLASIEEAITIGRQAGIRVHIAHLKALGRDAWGKSGAIVDIVAAAHQAGLRVTADQYPWQASGTRFSAALVPRWAMADDTMLERLNDPDLEDRIQKEMAENLWRRGGAGSLLVTGPGPWRGKTLETIAEEMDVDPVRAAIELVRAGDPAVASFNMQPDDIAVIASQPWVMTGSDGSSGHPRKYASYPKAYRDMVRAQRLFPMQRFVHRSAGLVADTFSLCGRGYLDVGRIADIVVLDLDRYAPLADFEDPTALSTGVVHMLVNGVPVIRGSEFTGALPGRVVRRGDCAPPSAS